MLSADNPDPPSWSAATAAIIGSRSDDEGGLLSTIAGATKFGSKDEEAHVVSGLRWLGLLSSKKITPRGNPLDTLCATLEEKMQYEEGDRDFVMLQHKFDIEWKNGSKEVRTSTLCEYGDKVGKQGYTSAMARLVGVPCAVAVRMVLEGKIEEKVRFPICKIPATRSPACAKLTSLILRREFSLPSIQSWLVN